MAVVTPVVYLLSALLVSPTAEGLTSALAGLSGRFSGQLRASCSNSYASLSPVSVRFSGPQRCEQVGLLLYLLYQRIHHGLQLCGEHWVR